MLAYSVLYVMSEHIRRGYAFAPIPLQVPTDAESIAKGKRLAKLYGCSEGRHGSDLSGGVLWYDGTAEPPPLQTVVAYTQPQQLLSARSSPRASAVTRNTVCSKLMPCAGCRR